MPELQEACNRIAVYPYRGARRTSLLDNRCKRRRACGVATQVERDAILSRPKAPRQNVCLYRHYNDSSSAA